MNATPTECSRCHRTDGTHTKWCEHSPDYDDGRRYKIVRMYFNNPSGKRTIARGLTLKEAQAHCKDPETSSKTATGSKARQRTKLRGPWFDGYEEDR
jgi:hypothetical protein